VYVNAWLIRIVSDTNKMVLVLVPYNCNSDFVGRSGILKSLEQQLGHGRSQGAKPRPRVALHGLGGIG